jgi:hypothetical protein
LAVRRRGAEIVVGEHVVAGEGVLGCVSGALRSYKGIVNNYIEDVGLELTMGLTPPLEPIVEVKVLRDCGEIVEKGIVLKKNLVFYINKKYVEKFIQSGDIVIIG